MFPITTQFDAAPNAPPLRFDFQPALQRVRIVTALDAGTVALDDAPGADLQDGSFWDDNVSLAGHKLRVTGREVDVRGRDWSEPLPSSRATPRPRRRCTRRP